MKSLLICGSHEKDESNEGPITLMSDNSKETVVHCFRHHPTEFFADRIYWWVHQWHFCLNVCCDFYICCKPFSIEYSWTGFSVNALVREYRCAPIPADSVSAVSVVCGSPLSLQKIWNLKKLTVHKFQNARQVRTGSNMVKSSSPNAPSSWLISLCFLTHTSPQNLPPFCFQHSSCSH
jgi:hypothetical protein